MLRDVDIANLVALGGWIRAFEIAAVTTHKNYSVESQKTCMRLLRLTLLQQHAIYYWRESWKDKSLEYFEITAKVS